MIRTKRMTLCMATEPEMRRLIENEPSEEMKQAYGEMLQGALIIRHNGRGTVCGSWS